MLGHFVLYTRFVAKYLVGPSLEKFLAVPMPLTFVVNLILVLKFGQDHDKQNKNNDVAESVAHK